MTPDRPRFQVWPFAALCSAVVLALVTISMGLDAPRSARGPDRASC